MTMKHTGNEKDGKAIHLSNGKFLHADVDENFVTLHVSGTGGLISIPLESWDIVISNLAEIKSPTTRMYGVVKSTSKDDNLIAEAQTQLDRGMLDLNIGVTRLRILTPGQIYVTVVIDRETNRVLSAKPWKNSFKKDGDK